MVILVGLSRLLIMEHWQRSFLFSFSLRQGSLFNRMFEARCAFRPEGSSQKVLPCHGLGQDKFEFVKQVVVPQFGNFVGVIFSGIGRVPFLV